MTRLPENQVFSLTDLIACRPGRISSRTLIEAAGAASPALALYALAEGESISDESSPHNKLITVSSGQIEITMGTNILIIKEGQSIIITHNTLHRFYAPQDCILIQMAYEQN